MYEIHLSWFNTPIGQWCKRPGAKPGRWRRAGSRPRGFALPQCACRRLVRGMMKMAGRRVVSREAGPVATARVAGAANRESQVANVLKNTARSIFSAALISRSCSRGLNHSADGTPAQFPAIAHAKVAIDFQCGLRLIERIKMNPANAVPQKVTALLGGP